ncbi:uncharacterized protein K452DRAFT_291588 [Aplosporella prunicola CBS 121167]|uniref:Uncharacterized protein n=1 Tax=Aplosporella prunicola CBS 121167 TaxID=1176127 RepID=A0A6A6B468_9PEZI|nr:uncharacterized protein K452DRAFT_291588 [Aplosporella prunicola CBS 121167]KAF2137541.1 hypothetical protein K452DRAFT_291588 [Aplosporella prunicola CBS 121167]
MNPKSRKNTQAATIQRTIPAKPQKQYLMPPTPSIPDPALTHHQHHQDPHPPKTPPSKPAHLNHNNSTQHSIKPHHQQQQQPRPSDYVHNTTAPA